jgi:hypothetical protein
LKTLRQKKLKAGKRAYNSDSLNAGDNTQQNKNAPLRKRQPQAPAVNNQ